MKLVMSAMTAALLLVPGIADAGGGWRYTTTVASNSPVEEPMPMESAAAAETTYQASAVSESVFAGSVPTNNLTMVQVREEFGQPDSEVPAVGEPPITRWVYAQYTVYFERDRVITSVIN